MPHVPRNIQAPYVAADFWTQWSSVNPRMCLCIKVTSKEEFGSEVVAFTTNTRDMTLPGHSGVTFRSAPAVTPTIVEQSLDEPANMEFTANYLEGFDQTEVLAGKWSFAEIEVFSTCWNNVNLGELLHFRGNLGEFKDYQTYFTAEARGLTTRLSQDIDAVTQRLCRSPEFRGTTGPFACKHSALTVTIGSNTHNITYTGILANSEWTSADEELSFLHRPAPADPGELPTETHDDGLFINGKIKCTSGANDGVTREIAYTVTIGPEYRVGLKRGFPFPIEVGDVFTLEAGCDRTVENCMRFSNIVNRRAEDYVPTLESITRLPPAN